MASSLNLGYVIVGDNIYYGCMISYEFMLNGLYITWLDFICIFINLII